MTKPLELKLDNREIEIVYETLGIGIDEVQDTDRIIADAATSKAVWKLHDWMIEEGFYDPNIDGNPAMFLQHALEDAGIQKPEIDL